MGPLTYMQKT